MKTFKAIHLCTTLVVSIFCFFGLPHSDANAEKNSDNQAIIQQYYATLQPGTDKHFLKIDTKDMKEKLAAEALLQEYFSKPYPGGGDGLCIGSLEDVSFYKNGEQHTLQKWPDTILQYQDNQLFIQSKEQRQLLTAIKPIHEEGWPETFILVDDIDFDGKPNFFVLEEPAFGSGTSVFRLIDWDKKSADGKPLFIPFDPKKLPPSPDDYGEQLFLQNAIAPQPGFLPEKKMLLFSGWNGPYHNMERWCFDGSHYFLCEKIAISYYANAVNMYELARFVRFDQHGEIISISCHALDDFYGTVELLFTAQDSISLYSSPGDTSPQTDTLHPGEVAIAKDFRMINDKYNPAIWYKVQRKDSKAPPAWCCVFVRDTGEFPGELLGLRKTKSGAEALVQSGAKQIILTSRPLAIYSFTRQDI